MNEQHVEINFSKMPKFERERLYRIVIECTKSWLAEQKAKGEKLNEAEN